MYRKPRGEKLKTQKSQKKYSNKIKQTVIKLKIINSFVFLFVFLFILKLCFVRYISLDMFCLLAWSKIMNPGLLSLNDTSNVHKISYPQ